MYDVRVMFYIIRSLAISAGPGLSGSCSSSRFCQLHDTILLPVKAGTGTGTNESLLPGVPNPSRQVDDE